MSQANPLAIVVLAAGQGTRMRSAHAKVLHALGGVPLIAHVLHACRGLQADRTIVVIGHQAEKVRTACNGFDAEFALQREQRGTGHAVIVARDVALRDFRGDVLILYGDVPLLTEATLRRLVEKHRQTKASLSLLTTVVDDAAEYGRIVRGEDGRLAGIIEARDATAEQREICEINPGIYCVASDLLFPALDRLSPNNAQGEIYLTDVVALAVGESRPVITEPADPREVAGINSRRDLAALEALLRERTVGRLMDEGVTFLDPSSVWIESGVSVGADTVIGPCVQLRGKTRIGRDCRIDGNAFVIDAEIDDSVHLRSHVVLSECRVASGAILGPFAHLRPGASLAADVHIGNFVEVKKSTIGERTKANHLAYIGDAVIGQDTNIGAGTITCNYDGFVKHVTTIGDRVQIGSDSQLVAPVRIGDDAYVATGTTVRHDVEPGALAFNPKPDQRRTGWVEGFRKRRGGAKP